MDIKDEFKSWLDKVMGENSNAGPSYMKSLDWLSRKFYEKGKIERKSIFEINDVDLITRLYKETKKIQRDKSSYIYNKEAPSYGERYYFSASLNKYKEFLLSKSKPLKITNFNYNSFLVDVKNSGLLYSQAIAIRFIASLQTKPFVILTGLSGSGKTKLAQAFVQWICEEKSQYKIIPVGADWTNREPLLGYPNALMSNEYVSPENGALGLIIEASKKENENKPYFLVLDEMNLSHVERYFADFLSAMESNEPIPLHSLEEPLKTTGKEEMEISGKIYIPENLFIIGTVNIDETTHMFSPKVLDRANTIEFRISQDEMEEFFGSFRELDMKKLTGKGSGMSKNFVESAKNRDIALNDKEKIQEELLRFFEELAKTGTEFGYRTAGEILLLISNLKKLDSGIETKTCIDFAIMQKMLPKLHGSRRKLIGSLEKLAELCCEDIELKDISSKVLEKEDFGLISNVKIKYPLSLEKIYRMYKSAVQNGFASYAEA